MLFPICFCPSSVIITVHTVDVDARYQEWLEKNKVDNMHSDSADEMQQTPNRHRRFGTLFCLYDICASVVE